MPHFPRLWHYYFFFPQEINWREVWNMTTWTYSCYGQKYLIISKLLSWKLMLGLLILILWLEVMTKDMLAPSKEMLCKAHFPFPSDDPAVNVLASFKPFSFFAIWELQKINNLLNKIVMYRYLSHSLLILSIVISYTAVQLVHILYCLLTY